MVPKQADLAATRLTAIRKQAAALSFAPMSLARMTRLTAPDQQQDLRGSGCQFSNRKGRECQTARAAKPGPAGGFGSPRQTSSPTLPFNRCPNATRGSRRAHIATKATPDSRLMVCQPPNASFLAPLRVFSVLRLIRVHESIPAFLSRLQRNSS